MTNVQKEILNFLQKYKSASKEQIIYFNNCTIQDINYLTSQNLIVKDFRTSYYYLKPRGKVDVRTVVALDVIKEAYEEIKEFGYTKNYPVIFSILTKKKETCDVAVVRKLEQERFLEKINSFSKAKKIIVILDNEKFDRTIINTKKEVLICTYPLKVIDKIN